jgi:hypothetical protein
VVVEKDNYPNERIVSVLLLSQNEVTLILIKCNTTYVTGCGMVTGGSEGAFVGGSVVGSGVGGVVGGLTGAGVGGVAGGLIVGNLAVFLERTKVC